MSGFYVLIGYFVIALIVFVVLDYFYAKKNTLDVDALVFISILWICALVGLILTAPFYTIDKLIKRKK